jgi:hypothetical protein
MATPSFVQNSCRVVLPTGKLGHPIGTYLRIEGHRYVPTKPPFKVEAGTMLVDTVQNTKLQSPVLLSISNVDIDSVPPEARCILKGYETGAWVGSPEGLPPGTPVEQTVFRFYFYFVATSVESPETLKIGR